MEERQASGEVIPREKRLEIREQLKLRDLDLVNQIALRECNAIRKTDEELSELYGMSVQAIQRFIQDRRDQIDRQKDEHKYGKFMVAKSISKTLALKEVMIEARMNGENELADRIKSILKESESVISIQDLKGIAEIYKIMGDDGAPKDGPTRININISQKMQEAQALHEARKKARIVDVSVENKGDSP